MTLKSIKSTVNTHVPITVIKHFFIYTFGKIATSALSFISAPIMMILLPTHQYGLLSIIHSFNNITMSVMCLGLVQLLLSEYSKCQKNTQKTLINTIITTYVLVALPLFILGIYFRSSLANFLFIPYDQQSMIYGILLICFFSFFNDLLYQILQITGQSLTVTTLQVSVAFLMVTSNILLIKFFQCDVQAAVWTQCATVLLVFAIACRYYIQNNYYNHFSLKSTANSAWHLLSMGLPLIPAAFTGWALALVNRWLLTAMTNLEITGIYSIADAGGQLMYRMILHPLQAAYGPYIMKLYTDSSTDIQTVEKNNHRIVAIVILFLLISVTIGYTITKPLLFYLVPQRYSMAIDCAVWVLIGYIFLIGSYLVSTLIQFRQKQWIFLLVFLITLLIDIALAVFMVPRFGLWGITYTIALTLAISFALLAWFNRQELKKI